MFDDQRGKTHVSCQTIQPLNFNSNSVQMTVFLHMFLVKIQHSEAMIWMFHVSGHVSGPMIFMKSHDLHEILFLSGVRCSQLPFVTASPRGSSETASSPASKVKPWCHFAAKQGVKLGRWHRDMPVYPLVMTHIAMENGPVILDIVEKSQLKIDGIDGWWIFIDGKPLNIRIPMFFFKLVNRISTLW